LLSPAREVLGLLLYWAEFQFFRMNISILILTHNEEVNLPGCLESVAWSDDVVVFDSFSTDLTVEIARATGTRVVQRKFDNWAAHQNWAMENIPFKYLWVFYLDADERMTPELREEICQISADLNEDRVAFYCGRKNFFMGKWIKHAYPPSLLMRFFRPSSVKFERLVNPTAVITGRHGYLKNLFLHYNFSKGIAEWIEKHNNYSSLEALEGMKILNSGARGRSSLFASDSAERRKALKAFSFRLPCRPLIKFIYLYFVKLGFLDGSPGLTYCVLQSIYEYMIVLKMKEIRLRQEGRRL
jgi:glycosyltransferase involved in cell wall biosynthesis